MRHDDSSKTAVMINKKTANRLKEKDGENYKENLHV